MSESSWRDSVSVAEQRLQLASAIDDAKDRRVLVFDAVHNHVFAHGEAAEAGAEIFLAWPSDIGEAGKRKETVRDGINPAIGNLDAAAFPGDVKLDVIKICFGAWGDAMCHQRGAVSSARRRARPRSFTSPASCRIDSCVTTRPSPRAREVRASSSVRKNSARCRSRSSHKARASCTASSSEWSRPLSIARRAKAFWSGVSCTSIVSRIEKTGL